MESPVNAASVALIDGDRVLLIRRARAPFAGLWTLPGGRLEAGETAAAGAMRELREELGLAVSGLRAVATMKAGAWRLAVFASRTFDGALVPSAEIAGHRWVSVGEISNLNSTPELAEVVKRAFEVVGG